MGTAGGRGVLSNGIESGGIVVARTAAFAGDNGRWGHDMVASDVYDVERGGRGVDGFLTVSLFPIGVHASPPLPWVVG